METAARRGSSLAVSLAGERDRAAVAALGSEICFWYEERVGIYFRSNMYTKVLLRWLGKRKSRVELSLSRLSLLSLPSSLDPRWSSSFFLSAPPSPRSSISAQSRSAFSREFIVSSVTIGVVLQMEKREMCSAAAACGSRSKQESRRQPASERVRSCSGVYRRPAHVSERSCTALSSRRPRKRRKDDASLEQPCFAHSHLLGRRGTRVSKVLKAES